MDGVFARGLTPGVMGERGAGVDGVLFKRVRTSGLEEDEGWGRRDMCEDKSSWPTDSHPLLPSQHQLFIQAPISRSARPFRPGGGPRGY